MFMLVCIYTYIRIYMYVLQKCFLTKVFDQLQRLFLLIWEQF